MDMAIQDKIEELRSQMETVALGKPLTDPRVVEASEKLDVLISEFYYKVKGLMLARY